MYPIVFFRNKIILLLMLLYYWGNLGAQTVSQRIATAFKTFENDPQVKVRDQFIICY